MSFSIFIITVVVACGYGITSSVFAVDKEYPESGNHFGVKIGSIGSGKIDGSFPGFFSSGGEVETESGFTFGIFADQGLNDRLSLGFYLDFHQFKAEDESERMVDIGLALKGNVIRNNSNVSLRPGMALGYGYLGEFMGRDRMHFLNLKGFFELYYTLSEDIKLVGEVATFGSPFGGNRNIRMNFGPMLLLRTGLSF